MPLGLDLEAIEADPPLHPAASPEERALLSWARDHAIDRPSPPLVNGRYKLPHPATGKGRTWTRMSNLAKTLDDGEGLTIWRMRLVTAGLKAQPQLLQQVDLTDKGTVNTATTAAAIWGGDNLRAALGTAMHTALEHVALGHHPDLPAPYDRDLQAIEAAIAEAGLAFPAEMIEATLVNPALEAVGRCDLAAAGPWEGDLLRIADLKTGSSLQPIQQAAQLAGYATSPHRWTPDGYQPVENLDPTVGLLIHAPLGTATCTIVELDLTEGRKIADLCVQVRKRRTGATKLCTQIVKVQAEAEAEPQEEQAPDPADPPTSPAFPTEPSPLPELLPAAVLELRATAIRGRLKAIAAEAREQIVRTWPADTPHRPPWTDQQILALEALLWAHDGQETPFDPPASEPRTVDLTPPAPIHRTPPWPVPDDGGAAEEELVAQLVQATHALTTQQRGVARVWTQEAAEHGRPWGPATGMTRRTHAINQAATELVQVDEPTARLLIEYATGLDLEPNWATGAILGALTVEQALDVAETAALHLAGDPTVTSVIQAAQPAAT